MALGQEPAIVVNGTTLTQAQAMTVRVALTCYLMMLSDDPEFCDKDLRQGYLTAGREVGRLMAT
jgi:hypothetical protein